MHMLRPTLLTLVVLLGCQAAQAEPKPKPQPKAVSSGSSTSSASIWKWRDAQGVLQISDRPPPSDVPDRDILQRPGKRQSVEAAASAATPAPAAAATADTELEARKKKLQQAEAAKAKEKEDQKSADAQKMATARAENCQRARNQLKGLQDGLRFSKVNEKGEREVLDDAGRANEIKRTQSIIDSDCK